MSFRRKGRKDVLYTSDFNDIVDAIEELQDGGGSSSWGGITGTLSAQTDLQAALDAKASSTHQHAGSGTSSTAIGAGSVASSDESTAIGASAEATALSATAIGYDSTASGASALAMGWQSIADQVGATAIGRSAQARSILSTALGYTAQVPSTSARSGALGGGAVVPASTPDTLVAKFNDVQIVRSNSTGSTRLGLLSPDGTVGWLTVTDADGVAVNGSTLLDARTPPYKELLPLSGTRDFGPATHGLGVVYNSVASMTANVLYFVPIYFGGSETITRVSINVQVAGAAGAAIRTGLFTGSAPSGATPAGRSLQTLVADWGTQAATSTGTKNWTVSTAVTRGWYWFGIVGNDSAVTTHTISSPQGYEQPSVQGQPNNCHYKISHGAGPAAFAATETPFTGNNQHPAFTFRVS